MAEKSLSLVRYTLSKSMMKTSVDILGYPDAYAHGCVALTLAVRYYDPSCSKFSTYAVVGIFRYVRRQAFKELTYRNRYPAFHVFDDGSSASEQVADREEAQQDDAHERLDSLMRQLDPLSRYVIVENWFNQRRYKDIAIELGISRQAVCNRVKRAFQKLRKFERIQQQLKSKHNASPKNTDPDTHRMGDGK